MAIDKAPGKPEASPRSSKGPLAWVRANPKKAALAGAGVVVAALLVKSKASGSSSSTPAPTPSTSAQPDPSIDPSTGLPWSSELGGAGAPSSAPSSIDPGTFANDLGTSLASALSQYPPASLNIDVPPAQVTVDAGDPGADPGSEPAAISSSTGASAPVARSTAAQLAAQPRANTETAAQRHRQEVANRGLRARAKAARRPEHKAARRPERRVRGRAR